MKFTKSGIDALTCPPGKRDVMFTDSEVKGFAIRVNATGSKTFLFNYRFGGKGRRLVLGQYGELTLAHARKLAEAARGKVLAGGHPAEEKKAVAQAFQQQAIEDARQAAANALTFEALIDRWISNALRDSSESHRTEAPRRLRLNFADMLNRPAHALTVAEVQTRLDDVAEKHPTTARRLLSYGRALYSWATKRQLVEENPFAHVVVEGREVSRDRVLTDAELGAAWRASAAPHAQDAALLALSDAFWQIHNEIWSADYLAEHEYGSPEQKRLEAKLRQLCRQEGLLVKQLAQIPARTQSGLKAKAAILQSLLPDIMRDCYLSDDSGEFLLVMSLLGDLTGGAA